MVVRGVGVTAARVGARIAVLVVQKDQPDGDGAHREREEPLGVVKDIFRSLREHVHGGALDVVTGAVREQHTGVQV